MTGLSCGDKSTAGTAGEFACTAAFPCEPKHGSGSETDGHQVLPHFPDASLEALPGGGRDFELDWSVRLLLHHDGAVGYVGPMAAVANPQPQELAIPELAVEAQVAQHAFLAAALHLQTNPAPDAK